MSFSASSVPWWGWLLCALPLWFVSWVCSTLYEEAKYSARSSRWERTWERTLAAVFRVAAFLCVLAGLVSFVKWAWPG